MSRRCSTAWAAVLAVTFGLAASGEVGSRNGDDGKLRVKGSDTMLLLVRQWAKEFMEAHPGISVDVDGGGTAKGLRALIAGDVDLASASRPLRPEEARLLVEHQGTLGYSVLTARDALSVYVHPSNPVTDLSLEQLRGIFTGDVRRWSEVGGPRGAINVVNRNPASGSRLFFAEHVLGGADYTRRAKVVATMAAVAETVGNDPNAIGYGGIGHPDGVRLCSVGGVTPTPAHVRDGTYPIARYLYLYTAVPPRGNVKQFVDWVLGDGQAVVTRAGYVALHDTPPSSPP